MSDFYVPLHQKTYHMRSGCAQNQVDLTARFHPVHEGVDPFMRSTSYQVCSKIATFLRRLFLCVFCCGFLLSADPGILLASPPAENRRPERSHQLASSDASHLLLQPALESSLVLLTHTLDIHVATIDGRSLTLQVEASYRLHNEEDEAITTTPARHPTRGRSGLWASSTQQYLRHARRTAARPPTCRSVRGA